MKSLAPQLKPEVTGILRSMNYLAHQARVEGMDDIADIISEALHQSGEVTLSHLAQDTSDISRSDKAAILALVSQFFKSSDEDRKSFIAHVETLADA